MSQFEKRRPNWSGKNNLVVIDEIKLLTQNSNWSTNCHRTHPSLADFNSWQWCYGNLREITLIENLSRGLSFWVCCCYNMHRSSSPSALARNWRREREWPRQRCIFSNIRRVTSDNIIGVVPANAQRIWFYFCNYLRIFIYNRRRVFHSHIERILSWNKTLFFFDRRIYYFKDLPRKYVTCNNHNYL